MQGARVTAIQALDDLRAALATFQAEGRDALGAVDQEARRSFDWLSDQKRYWQAQIRKREDEVFVCKQALNRKLTVAPGDRVPDTTEERKALKRAQARLEGAHDKLEATKKWEPRLRRDVEEYRGPAQGLANFLDTDLERSLGKLARMAAALEAYTQISGPATGGRPSVAQAPAEPPKPPPPAAPEEPKS